MFKLLKSIAHFPRISPSRVCLIKADGFIEKGYYKEALTQAEKARDFKDASVYEVKIAQGKMLEIIHLLKKENIPKI